MMGGVPPEAVRGQGMRRCKVCVCVTVCSCVCVCVRARARVCERVFEGRARLDTPGGATLQTDLRSCGGERG